MGRATSESVRRKWRRIISRQRGSGLSVAEFCRTKRVPQSSLFAWKRRLATEPAQPAFIEVTPPAVSEPSWPPLELLLGRGRRLVIRPGFDAQALREVVRALEELSPPQSQDRVEGREARR